MKRINRIALVLALAVLSSSVANAEGKLSSSTYAFLNSLRNNSGVEELAANSAFGGNSARGAKVRKLTADRYVAPVQMANGVQAVQAFVSIDGWNVAPIDEMEALGVQVNGQMGDVLTVTAPIDKLEALAKVSNVRQVSVARKLRLKTDKQRASAYVDEVLAGNELAIPYTGKDVVVGVIDVGIDYNHMAFKDANGNTRIKRVYMPNDDTGSKVVLNGSVLPGSEFTTQEQISKLTADEEAQSHGTHTSAIAAGTQVGNFGGMAPEADLVLCGLGDDLSDVNLVNSINYIFSYAKSVGKPAVINISLGDHYGPHDGSTDICKSLESLVDDGHLLVLAAGNEGGDKVHFSTTFTNSGDNVAQKTVLFDDIEYGGGAYSSSFEIYANSGNQFAIQYVVVDKKGNQLALSKKQTASPQGVTFDMKTHNTFKNYYEGKAVCYSELDENSGKWHVYIDVNCKSTSLADDDWYLGVVFWGKMGEKLNGWNLDSYAEFTNLGLSKFIPGDSEMSISGMATGEKTISVGAFVSKSSYIALDGKEYSYGFMPNDIASFSSYGPDANGKKRPDILAGGSTVVSAVNRYDSETVKKGYNYLAAEVSDNKGNKHYWGDMSGTSMAAPEVTGILALWLQAKPTLSYNDVLEVFENTSVRDNYVNKNAKKSGYGKIDAWDGIKYVISTSGINDVKQDADNVIICQNPSDGNFSVFAPNEDAVAVRVYSISGALIYDATKQIDGGVASVSLAGRINPGVYVVTVTGDKLRSSSRLIVK